VPAQLLARDLTFSHGPVAVLAGVSVRLAPGRRVGIVGPNGVGKSTLLALLAGELVPESGTVRRVPGDATVGLLRQELETEHAPAPTTAPDADPPPREPAAPARLLGVQQPNVRGDRGDVARVSGETVAGLLARQTGVAEADRELEAATSDYQPDRYDAALDRWMRLGGADLDARMGEMLARIGLDPGMAAQPVASLSGGEKARVGLAALLLSRFDVLLLDEPTNNLDQDGLAQLETFVLGSGAAIALVSHDRRFLERVVTDVLELDEHTRTGTEFGGGWVAYRQDRATARRHAEQRYATFAGQRNDLRARARREREWSTQGVQKAASSGETDKYIRHFRTQTSEQLAGRARRTEAAMARLEEVDKPWEGWDLRFSIADADRGGDLVAEVAGAVVERGGFRLGPLTLSIHTGERVAVVGNNGSGKTTLLRALLGDLPLASGTQRIGASVVVGRLDQARERFAATASLLDGFVAETGASTEESRSVLAKFGLGAEHVGRATDALSPGERTRATLAAFQLQGVNLLVLDEPTNHLDLPAIEQLERALESFGGTVLLVTHDRAFLEAVRLTRRIELDAGQVRADSPV
jgi:ATPase subunit of ABC transporter with duplicated ATPase domains